MEIEDFSKKIHLYIELKDSYEKKYKYKNIYPREWYDIDDYDIKNKLLKEALGKNVLLFDLDLI